MKKIVGILIMTLLIIFTPFQMAAKTYNKTENNNLILNEDTENNMFVKDTNNVQYSIDSRQTLSAFTNRPMPTIDGRIEQFEWGDADTVMDTFDLGPWQSDIKLYVKNDKSNLYLAAEVRWDDYDQYDFARWLFLNDPQKGIQIGDDGLAIRGGDGRFDDLYRHNNVEGWWNRDTNDGGTNDKAGINLHYEHGGMAKAHFECIHPLNTPDNNHDFSLSLGDEIGFRFEYDEEDEGEDAYPDKNTYGIIKIAEPSFYPLNTDADLTITGIEVTQAIQLMDNSMPLVWKKPTYARVYVDHGLSSGSIWAYVTLFISENRVTVGQYTRIFNIPSNPARSNSRDTENFLIPASLINSPTTLTFQAYVTPVSPLQGEQNYNNNWFTDETLSFHQTIRPIIHIIPVNTAPEGQTPNTLGENEIFEQELFLLAAYPVGEVSFPSMHWDRIGAGAPGWDDRDSLLQMLTDYALNMGIFSGSANQIYGFLPADPNTGGQADAIWDGGSGIAACGYRGSSEEGTMAHEIIHNYGPDTWGRHVPYSCNAPAPDPNWPYSDDDIQEFGYFSISGFSVVDDNTPDIMGYCTRSNPPKWVSPYRWENLFDRLRSSSNNQPEDIETNTESGVSYIISGWVSEESNKGHLNPIFCIPGEKESQVIPGNYSIILKDKYGENLLVKNFNLVFRDPCGHEPIDPRHFTMLIPHMEKTAIVLLLEHDKVLDQINVSDNTPEVQVISPNGGEVWENKVTIEWDAYDLDNEDSLTFRIYYSSDNGETWLPLSYHIKNDSYEIDADFISGSTTALIRVVASDGFNFGEDQSDEVFTVVTKTPTVNIVQPQDEAQFYEDEMILFRGFGNDVDDVVLSEDSYSWESNIDGFLGNGSILTTMLKKGSHVITLTVTDSNGDQCTDELNIEVSEVKIRNLFMPKYINFLQKIYERFSNLFPILRLLLQRLGLQN